MKTFIDDLQPVVLHLGGNYIFNQLGGMNLEKDITLLNIHNYLDVNSLFLLQENIGNSISVKTTLNSNNEFLDYFFDKQESSVVMIKSANYYDRVVNKRVDIDFVKDPLYANILDWVFRGDPKEHVILNVQTKTLNNNGSVTLSEIKQFKFNSSPVVDTINGQSSSRTNLQIPGVFFDKNNGLMTLVNSFNMRDVGGNPIRIQWLLRSFQAALPSSVRGRLTDLEPEGVKGFVGLEGMVWVDMVGRPGLALDYGNQM